MFNKRTYCRGNYIKNKYLNYLTSMNKFLYNKITKNYILNSKIKIIFNNKNSILYLLNYFGIAKITLPIFYLINESKKSLIFLKNNIYQMFINNFIYFYKQLNYLFFIKLKIKGLGYRFRKLSQNFYYFFFNYTNMYYFNIPKNIIIKWYKKRFILISWNFQRLKLLMSTIIILKNLGPYQVRGLKYPKQIILLKKKKKIF